jgi:hypothetical protein
MIALDRSVVQNKLKLEREREREWKIDDRV